MSPNVFPSSSDHVMLKETAKKHNNNNPKSHISDSDVERLALCFIHKQKTNSNKMTGITGADVAQKK